MLTGPSGGQGQAASEQPLLPLVPTTSTTDTTLPPSTTTTRVTPTTAAAQIPPNWTVATGAGALLTRPPIPETRTESHPDECNSLADPGWQDVTCRSQEVDGTTFTFLVEFTYFRGGKPGAFDAHGSNTIAGRAYLFRQAPDGSQEVMLEAIDDAGTKFVPSEADASFADVEPNGKQDVIFTFSRQQPPGSLSMDLVELPTAVVAVHQDLNIASVVTAPGELDTYSARTGAPDGPWTHFTIERVNGAWRTQEETITGRAVPATMFS
jgi:hypothetical protein